MIASAGEPTAPQTSRSSSRWIRLVRPSRVTGCPSTRKILCFFTGTPSTARARVRRVACLMRRGLWLWEVLMMDETEGRRTVGPTWAAGPRQAADEIRGYRDPESRRRD